ncbi:hypothetical protein ACTXT7_004475 [Hymenolepis weldensis]
MDIIEGNVNLENIDKVIKVSVRQTDSAVPQIVRIEALVQTFCAPDAWSWRQNQSDELLVPKVHYACKVLIMFDYSLRQLK